MQGLWGRTFDKAVREDLSEEGIFKPKTEDEEGAG